MEIENDQSIQNKIIIMKKAKQNEEDQIVVNSLLMYKHSILIITYLNTNKIKRE